jgi:formylglycine-generating enzyme required for sulfatase activity
VLRHGVRSVNLRQMGAALVGLVGVALIARSGIPAVQAARTVSSVTDGTAKPGIIDIPGFRRDAWFLADEPLLGFVEIPAGPFLMGSDATKDAQAYDNEGWTDGRSPHTVTVPTFYVGRYEVTAAQFRAFTDATDRPSNGSAGSEPAANVSWPDAMEYARWLTRVLRDSPNTPPELTRLLASGWRVTLPSEAQWEKAARGTDGRIYPWGNQPSRDLANYAGQSVRRVGEMRCAECAHGLSDMSGNVWELTRTAFRPGPLGADAEDLRTDALMVMRGGSFADDARNVRTTVRGGADPGARRPFIGFRVVLTDDAR